MRIIRTAILAVIIVFGYLINISAQEISLPKVQNSTNFKLTINGIDKIEGDIRIAVFNSEEKYTKDPVYAIVLPVDSTTMVWEKPKMPFGEYAIAVYHDKNRNGKIDTNLLGIPKEDYGFSNDARGRFGPASWKDSKFKLVENRLSAEINIK
ncbi:MAG: DUF2141 domain-containing protein [Balneola sp.]